MTVRLKPEIQALLRREANRRSPLGVVCRLRLRLLTVSSGARGCSETPAEALDESVLRRLARGDVVPFDGGLLAEAEDRLADQLGAVAHWEEARPLGDGARSRSHVAPM